ncbi:MAG: hypothetical protein JXR96_31230 [Deltaproteobacteria bacterium]|nr:hypothetical protein [Deltaproteobacteria bacterium]
MAHAGLQTRQRLGHGELLFDRDAAQRLTQVQFLSARGAEHTLQLEPEMPLGEERDAQIGRWSDELLDMLLLDRESRELSRSNIALVADAAQVEWKLRSPHSPIDPRLRRFLGWRGTWHQRFQKARSITARASRSLESAQTFRRALRLVLNLYPYFLDAQLLHLLQLGSGGTLDEAGRSFLWLRRLLPGLEALQAFESAETLMAWLEAHPEEPVRIPEGPASLDELLPPGGVRHASASPDSLDISEAHQLLRARPGQDEWFRARNCLIVRLLFAGLSPGEIASARIQPDPFLLVLVGEDEYVPSRSFFSLVEHWWLIGCARAGQSLDDVRRPLAVEPDGAAMRPEAIDALLETLCRRCGLGSRSADQILGSFGFDADRRKLE